MINNNSLGERLNAVKTGKPIPKPAMHPSAFPFQPPNKFTIWPFIINRTLLTINVFAASFLYGFAIKTIFATDWTLFGVFAVGFILNHAMTIWPRSIKNLFKN